ncbi:hypothetical protein CDL60_23015 [Roseateles noduli]|nr:hypothetical protein CDL60_23015 [Roseateles noduli]
MVKQLLEAEQRMNSVRAGLTHEQAQALVKARWQVERAWELLANHPDNDVCREDAAVLGKESWEIVEQLAPPLPQAPGVPEDPAAGRTPVPRSARPTEEEIQLVNLFFSKQLPAHVCARLRGQGVQINVVGSAVKPPETAASVVSRLCPRGPRAWFDEATSTLLVSGSARQWQELPVTIRLMRENGARFKLPLFLYAIGHALEASARPRGSQDPDLLAERAVSDHPCSLSSPDAAQQAALVLGRELAGVPADSAGLQRFVERLLGPAGP